MIDPVLTTSLLVDMFLSLPRALGQVIPYCMLNVALVVLLMILDRRYGYKVVEISNLGHTFVTVSLYEILESQ
jgi:hypothetical protein